MNIELPTLRSRWYKFMDPANKARIVEITWIGTRASKNLLEVHPEIDGLSIWDIEDFVRDFRPL